jgi:hypothetical protein
LDVLDVLDILDVVDVLAGRVVTRRAGPVERAAGSVVAGGRTSAEPAGARGSLA